MPEISIIIPTHNRAELLRRVLSSIYRQDCARAEVIVFDDNSTCDTQSMIASGEWPSLRYSRSGTAFGSSGARNRGAAMATGSWLWFIDDDDELHDGSIEAIAAGVSASLDVLMCFVETTYPDGKRLIPNRQKLPTDLDSTDLLTLTRRPITCSQVIVRADLFRSIGGFDEGLRSSNDVDLWLRLLLEGFRVAVVSRVLLTKYEHSPTQLSRNLPDAFADQQAFLRKWSSQMKSRLGEEQFAVWYYNRLMVTYNLHCGRAQTPSVPLGLADSFRYAGSWRPLIFHRDSQMRKRALEKATVSLLRACIGASLFRRLRAAG